MRLCQPSWHREKRKVKRTKQDQKRVTKKMRRRKVETTGGGGGGVRRERHLFVHACRPEFELEIEQHDKQSKKWTDK